MQVLRYKLAATQEKLMPHKKSEPRIPVTVTLADVARTAGVSRATASLVLRKSPLVAAATRSRVHEAVKELGYIYNRGAANLRASRTHTVGLLISNINNPFFSELTVGVDAALDAAGYVAFLANTDESLDRQERFLKRMREQNVDGIILCPAVGSSREVLRQLMDWGVPCVQTLRFISAREGDYVGADYERGLEQVTEHLIRLGHRRIALVGGDKAHSATLARRAGFAAAMRRHQLADDLVLKLPPTRRTGVEAVGLLLGAADAPTAAVCFNDVVALGMMAGLHARGIRPGLDFAVTGVDDTLEAALSYPALTTVSTFSRQVGEAAAQLLLKRIDDPAGVSERIVLPTRLVVRKSCGAMASDADTIRSGPFPSVSPRPPRATARTITSGNRS